MTIFSLRLEVFLAADLGLLMVDQVQVPAHFIPATRIQFLTSWTQLSHRQQSLVRMNTGSLHDYENDNDNASDIDNHDKKVNDNADDASENDNDHDGWGWWYK